MQKYIQQVDLETGEVLTGSFVAVITPKRHNGFNSGWVAMSTNGWDVIEQFKNIYDVKVFASLMKRLDFDNLILVNQTEIADKLGIARPHVARSIKNLKELGILEQGPKIGKSCSYRINPEMAWKGSAKSHVTALDDARKVKRERMAKAGITGVVAASDKPA